MLAFDLASLSIGELEEIVDYHCSLFGKVESIKILRPSDRVGYWIAVVSMATPHELDRVLVKIGDSKFGSSVVIRLEQVEEAHVASSVTARKPVDILLVEDDPADVRMTREALKAAGIPHRLHVVEDGLDAISFLYRTRQFDDAPEPHLILLDLNIPKINGHEVLNEIKTHDHYKHIPVVVLTCSKAERDRQRSYAERADRFVTKPAGLDAFVQEIKSIESLVAH